MFNGPRVMTFWQLEQRTLTIRGMITVPMRVSSLTRLDLSYMLFFYVAKHLNPNWIPVVQWSFSQSWVFSALGITIIIIRKLNLTCCNLLSYLSGFKDKMGYLRWSLRQVVKFKCALTCLLHNKISVTRLGDLLLLGQLFKAFGYVMMAPNCWAIFEMWR